MNSATVRPAASPGPDGRSARWDRHRTERRRELIRAARHAVHRLGPDASMEDIAAAAGTSKPVFYRYFGDKAGLQQAMGEVVVGRMQARLQEAAASATTPQEGLTAMVSVYLQMAESSPHVYAFVTRDAPFDPSVPQPLHGEPAPPAAAPETGSSAVLHDFFANVTAMIEAPLRGHLSASADSAAELAAASYWPRAAIGMVRAAGERWLAAPDDGSKPSRELMTTMLTQWLLRGVAPGRTEPTAASGPPAAAGHSAH
ncbi:TetR/AcrR family transcriptional regulator [Arthrobacter sulfonylureivorans]|uniref:TetR/AcrR family transcriptional regulator n=1 Tax=Arthrobacter sulfonylureivorans TaxID=2486855 RepID=UPI0039E6C790